MVKRKYTTTTHYGEEFDYWAYEEESFPLHHDRSLGIYEYSQQQQDRWIQKHTNKKKNGIFVDIGAAHPIAINNTIVLEKELNWTGISFDIGKGDVCYFENGGLLQDYIDLWNKHITTPIITGDVLKKDLSSIFEEHNLPKTIDYLSIDLEPPYKNFEILENVMELDYIFNYITFETDAYRLGSGEVFQEEIDSSRELMKNSGYVLAHSFDAEDWYVQESVYDKNRDYSRN